VLLTLPTKEEILVSRERATEFKTWLGNWSDGRSLQYAFSTLQ
jgi:hypothetical protein